VIETVCLLPLAIGIVVFLVAGAIGVFACEDSSDGATLGLIAGGIALAVAFVVAVISIFI